ncbi:MAG TPA: hypothetical protein VGK67_15595 [Myxococcales bacterium]
MGFLGYELPVRFRAVLQYRQLAVVDQTPANDRAGNFDFVLSFKPSKAVSTFVTLGVLQKGWAEQDETGAFFKDMSLGVSYTTGLSLDGLGVGLYEKQQATLGANVRLWLPTSRASDKQTLYLAPELRLVAEAPVLPNWISIGLEFRTSYRFHQLAERAGPEGGMNTRFTMQAIPYLDAEVLKLGKYGTINVELDVWWVWALLYPSRDGYVADASSQSAWRQNYGWDLGIAYHPKPWAKVTVSLEHGGSVLRDGIVNTFFTHRDETELAATLDLLF